MINSPKELKEYLDLYIVGQEDAKTVLSNVAFSHVKRMSYNCASPEDLALESDYPIGPLPKQNVLLMGPSGTGKTYMIKKLSEKLGLPMHEVAATGISPCGYAGLSFTEHMESLWSSIRQKTDGQTYDTIFMQYAIVFIDEIDKICIPASSKDGDFHKQIQHSLLKYIEGAPLHIEERAYKQKSTLFPEGLGTHNMLFICAGNFEKLRKNREMSSRTMGFVNEIKSDVDTLHNDIIKAGMIPELVGRLAIAAELEPLTKDDIRRILLEAEDSIIDKYKRFFAYIGYELDITDEQIDEIVEYCFANEIGVRGLEYMTYKVLEESIYEAYD